MPATYDIIARPTLDALQTAVQAALTADATISVCGGPTYAGAFTQALVSK